MTYDAPTDADAERSDGDWNPLVDHELLQAWQDYCERLRDLGTEILRDAAPKTRTDRAEGFRYLARLVAMGIESGFGHDSEVPMLRRSLGTNAKMYGDNPDTLYEGCALDPDGTYRVHGTIGAAHLLVFNVTRDASALGKGKSTLIGQVYGDDLDVNDDGTFELWLGGEPRDRNWMALEEDAARLAIRQIMGDWSAGEPGRFIIERVDAVPESTPYTPEQFVAELAVAARTPALVPMWANESDTVRQRANSFYLDDHDHQKQYGGVPGGEAVLSWFELEPLQALIIEVTPPPCKYWNLQIGNYWYESFDYRRRLSSVNCRQAVPEDDGVVRMVVAHTDPGVPNWLDTCGHREGHLALRWVEADHHPVPSAEVVDLASWQRTLPSTAKRFNPAQRADQVAARRRAVDRRFVP